MTMEIVPPPSRAKTDAGDSGVTQREVKMSPRQCELLRWLDRGYAHKEIAARMGVALSTEMAQFAIILAKLGLATRSEVRRWAQTHTAAVATPKTPAPRELHPDGCPCDAHYCRGQRLLAA
jgi:DNA-binding NarL/FixJ family response regulator